MENKQRIEQTFEFRFISKPLFHEEHFSAKVKIETRKLFTYICTGPF
jgi:hypothetical protein